MATATRVVLRKSFLQREGVQGWLLASPWIIGFLVFTAFPLVFSFGLVFTDWDLFGTPEFVGLENIDRFISDNRAHNAFIVTTKYAVCAVSLNIVIGLGIAVLLNQNVPLAGIMRAVYFLPSILPAASIAIIWRWIFSGDYGLLNWLLSLIGVMGPNWVHSRQYALVAVIIIYVWQLGNTILLFISGLQNIPGEVLEAAEVDGAGAWKRFTRITIPLLSPVILFNLIIGIINSLQVFTVVVFMTGGGPRNSTEVIMLYLYNNAFRSFRMGYASTLAWALFLYILVLTMVAMRWSKSWVYYGGE